MLVDIVTRLTDCIRSPRTSLPGQPFCLKEELFERQKTGAVYSIHYCTLVMVELQQIENY